MKLFNTAGRIALAWVAVVVTGTVAGILVPLKAPPVPHLASLWLLSNFLTAGALAIPGVRSEWRGLRLGAGLAAIPLFVGLADALDGAVFIPKSGIPWEKVALLLAVTYVLVIPLWGFVFSRREGAVHPAYHPFSSNTMGQTIVKFVLSDVVYVFLYFLAGTIIFPHVREFYATQNLPSHAKIAVLQLLVRGPLFVVLCLLLLRMLRLPRSAGALATGVIFTVVSGVAPLIIPNPYLPDAVRWVHFCEVVSSNFVFGTVVGLLWGPPNAAALPGLNQPA